MDDLVGVGDAERIILDQCRDFGNEKIPLEQATGRILAEPITADRDLPPYNRATMDGIAIRSQSFQEGIRQFRVKALQPAGAVPACIEHPDECIEIMTGAAVPDTTDTVIPYEEIQIQNGVAHVMSGQVQPGQFIHGRGRDRKQHELLVPPGRAISPPVIALAAATGRDRLLVKRRPRILIASSGDELVEIRESPSPYQVRRSNPYMLHAALAFHGLQGDLAHLPDAPQIIQQRLEPALRAYDVLLLSGGVSKGKYDFLPGVLENLGVTRLFHRVRQRPGKPFWFGVMQAGPVVFAFPGNPVSSFLCLHRYFLPWWAACLGQPGPSLRAVVEDDLVTTGSLRIFQQVKLRTEESGRLVAVAAEGNGSGDFANLLDADGFLELPEGVERIPAGSTLRVWPYQAGLFSQTTYNV